MLMALIIVRLEYYTMCIALVNMLSLTWTKAWLILAVLLADASKAKDLLMDFFWGLSWPKTIDLVTYIISSMFSLGMLQLIVIEIALYS